MLQIEIRLTHPQTGLERTLQFASDLPPEEIMWMLKQLFEPAPPEGAQGD